VPTLPLPPWSSGATPLDGGVLPVSSTADVAAEWAPEIQQPPVAPLRDAIQDGQAAALLEYQRASRYAAAQSDPGRGTDEYEDEILEEHGVYRQPGESNAAARARMFAGPTVVSMTGIIAAANAVLAPYTTISCVYAEESDGCFACSSSSNFSTHAFSNTDAGTAGHTPNYPDRLYPGSVAAGLQSLPLRRPPGCMPNIDVAGRWFLLRVPDISSLDNDLTTVDSSADTVSAQGGVFAGVGVSTTDLNITFSFQNAGETSNQVYQAVIAAVNPLVGEGVRWSMVVDPLLVTDPTIFPPLPILPFGP
jgi:hypothetical protein